MYDCKCSNCNTVWLSSILKLHWGKFTSNTTFIDELSSEYKLIYSDLEVSMMFNMGDYICDKCIKTINYVRIDHNDVLGNEICKLDEPYDDNLEEDLGELHI